MKKALVLSFAAVSLSVNALPTYEPFTEFAPLVGASPTNAIDLATGGYSAPGGEKWSGLLFSGLATGAGQTAGLDVLVTTNGALYTANSTVFPGNIVSSLLPPGFPGAATNLIQNPAFMANAGSETAYPGYYAPNIADWTSSVPNEGINGPGINGDTGLFSNGDGSPFGPANQANGPYTYLFIQGLPTGYASQSLPSLAPNTSYVLSFLAAARSGETADTFQVQIGDANGMGDIFSSGTNAANDSVFVNYSYTFTTPASFSGTPSIQLQNVTTTNATYTSGKTVNFTAISVAPASAPTSIPIFVVNPSQPGAPSTTVGNSAVLNFAQDITRPASGTKTLYVSYLFSVAQQGQLGGGNDGRYMAFFAASNLVEPSATYPYWNTLFNVFGGSPKYCGHGLLSDVGGVSAYVGACDTSAGKDFAAGATPFVITYNAPSFVVGAYTFTSGQGTKDTNSIWVNPLPGAFGGAAPPVSPTYNDVMAFNMSDLGGLVLIDRVGSGASGGLGTNYIANLLVGSTWSYVTGGPEFTNQPAGTFGTVGGSATITAAATAAAQTVTYQWERIQDGSTNPVVNGLGGAGGSAMVSGATTANLTLTGIQSGDYGTYEVVATASGTGFSLASAPALLATDPVISVEPQPVQVNYGGVATFSVTCETKAPTLNYVWSDNGTALANGPQADGSAALNAQGAITNSGSGNVITLTMSNVSYLDDGNYSVAITNNDGGGATSATATLDVIDPYIAVQPTPASQIVTAGSNATISVVAAGTDVSYQWYGNNQGQLADNATFSGVTNAILTISNVQDAQADSYYVTVNGASGSQLQSSYSTLLIGDTNAGPFSPDNWPGSLVAGAGVQVDYCILDPNASFNTPPNWNDSLSLAVNSGDQTYTTMVPLDSLYGDEVNNENGFLNVADSNFAYWTNVPVIDVLMQVYGNSSVYTANPIAALEGEISPANTLTSENVPVPLGANNQQWNWMLMEVTNPIDVNGLRTVGDNSVTSSRGEYSGVNDGTIRFQSCNGWIVRAIAWGPQGVFGASNQVNVFPAAAACAPQPTNNLTWVDFNLRQTNFLEVLSNANLGYTYTVQSGVGPSGDLRTAIQCTSDVMNFGILSNYLGYPCNNPLNMELGIEFYDDPNLAGTTISPSQYATDGQGDLATYTGLTYTTQGTGEWLKLGFTIPAVDVEGVNTAPLTGGPTLSFSGTAPFIDRVELGVYLTGTNALAGQAPDPAYEQDPLVCQTNYGYFASWNPSAGVTNNNLGPAGHAIALGGPAGNQLLCEVPGGSSGNYLVEFGISNSIFGPLDQGNLDMTMSLTYYDDPALAGSTIALSIYYTYVIDTTTPNGVLPVAPYSDATVLQGTGRWVTANFELPNVCLYGVYGSAAGDCVVRWVASDDVAVSAAQFNVIRPCGVYEGIDYLQTPTLTATTNISLAWRGAATVQATSSLLGPWTNIVTVTNNSLTNTYSPVISNRVPSEFYRLLIP